jgi:peptidoglycan/LPS O-acetylase OafA/YrhL
MLSALRGPLSTRVGFTLFGIGLVFVLVTVLPFFFHDHNRPLWLNLGCMLAPLGFVIAITSVVRTGRAEQRAALANVLHDRP